MLSSETINTITSCIQLSDGQEVCGFLLFDVVGGQRFQRVNNLFSEPHSFFVSQFEFERLQRHAQRHHLQIRAFIHSHQSSLKLSGADISGLEGSNIPWIVVAVCKEGLQFKVYERAG
jgi:proteasome lid subunit RPN8/RPN11